MILEWSQNFFRMISEWYQNDLPYNINEFWTISEWSQNELPMYELQFLCSFNFCYKSKLSAFWKGKANAISHVFGVLSEIECILAWGMGGFKFQIKAEHSECDRRGQTEAKFWKWVHQQNLFQATNICCGQEQLKNRKIAAFPHSRQLWTQTKKDQLLSRVGPILQKLEFDVGAEP